MQFKKRISICLGIAAVFGCSRILSAQIGLIEGTVTVKDSENAETDLKVDIVGSSVSSTPKATVSVDSNGHFAVSGLAFGDYVIFLFVPGGNSRFPRGTLAFYTPEPTRTTLSQAVPHTRITVPLPRPAALLRGTIRDSATSLPVPARISMWRADDERSNLIFEPRPEGTYQVAVPSGIQIVISISAQGYVEQRKTAVFSEPNQNLDVALTRQLQAGHQQ